MIQLCVFSAGLALAYASLSNENCGVPAISPTSPFIVGGKEAKPHSYPWMISLLFDDGYDCGATLISQNYAITAAHCLHGSGETSRLKAVLGSHSRVSAEEGQKIVSIKKITWHVDYNTETVENDIAVIEFGETITFTDTISPVCIATQDYPAGQMTTVTGWGTLSSNGPLAERLMEVHVPIVSHSQCSSWLSGVHVDNETMICAGYAGGNMDACQSDSGGPMMVLDNGKWYLLGIVSWGRGCAEKNSPGVYARVPYYTDWIKIHTDVR